MKLTYVLSTSCLVIALNTTEVLAAPIALGFGDGISYISEHNASTSNPNVFEIGGPDDGFYFDPNAGGWEKHLLAPPNGFEPNGIYCVQEWFTFNPSPPGTPSYPLADWHETIELGLDGQQWDIWTDVMGPPIITADPASGEPIAGLQYMFNESRTSLWFDFDPIDIGPDGLTLHIQKYFRYTGSTVSFDPVVITQYPTPTPGTLALLGFAGIAASRRRR